ACVAGVLSLEEALGLVAERGRLMGSLPRGAMLAVQATEADLAARLTGYPALSVAAINGPSSCVASGPEAEIGRLEAELAGTPTAHRRVHTSHAFHSAMMDPILGAFAERVRQTRLSAPSIPFLSNLTGTWITAEQATDPAYWVGHLRSAVRFADNLATLLTDPARVLLEVGPGTSLTSLARQQGSPDITLVASLRHPKQGGLEEVALLEALGKLWCAGIDIDWQAFHTGFGRRRVPLPTYPFERRRHWIEPGSGPGVAEATGVPAKEPDIARWFYAPGWKRSLTRGAAPEAEPPWLVFDDGSKLARAVVDLAVARGGSVTSVLAGAEFLHEGGERFRIDPRRRE